MNRGGVGGSPARVYRGTTAAAPAIAGDVKSEPAEAKVRQVGRKTFYLKDGRWLDSIVKPEDEARAKVIKQFSDDYFQLAAGQAADFNQYLAFVEPVTVQIGDTVYKIEPAPAKP